MKKITERRWDTREWRNITQNDGNPKAFWRKFWKAVNNDKATQQNQTQGQATA
jgi:hypothetical protein